MLDRASDAQHRIAQTSAVERSREQRRGPRRDIRQAEGFDYGPSVQDSALMERTA